MYVKLYPQNRRNALTFLLLPFFYLLGSFLCVSAAFGQLSGTYTIGGAGGDYANFSEALTALEAEGVAGPVTFKVRPGTYEEQLILNNFPGSSCSTPVVFEGEGARTQAIIQAPDDTAFVLQVNGADGISFRNLSINGREEVIETQPGTNCFSLVNNIIMGSVYARSDGNERSHQHLYRGNTFQRGGIVVENNATWNPAAPVFDEGLIIEENEFRNSAAAIAISGQEEFTIRNNRIDQSGAPIAVTNSWYGNEISGNTITVEAGDYQGTGIALRSSAASRITENNINLMEGGVGMHITTGKTTDNEILFANNLIDVSGYDARGHNYYPISNLIGLDITSTYGNQVKMYHNTILVSGYSEYVPNYTLSLAGESNSFYLINNVIANSSYGTVIDVNGSSVIAAMDYNNLYGQYSTQFATYGNQGIGGLTEWQSVTGFDEHSINVNPHSETPPEAMVGAGIYLEEVPRDIFGQLRNNPPTIGAVESGELGTALSGTYTIGGETGDYANFTEAIAALERVGVEDSVHFYVQPGQYHEQLNIRNFRDADVKITFEGAGGDSSQVVLEYPLEDALVIRNSRNITFRNLTISSGVDLNNSSNILFENNVIVGGVSGYSVEEDVYRNNLFKGDGISKNSQGYNSTDGHFFRDGPVTIENNTFEVQGSAISLSGQTEVIIRNNQITVEENEDVSSRIAIDLSSSHMRELNNNSITSLLSDAIGIQFGGAFSGSLPERIMNNKIHLPNGGTGINFYYSVRGSSLVANNMISINADSSSTGIAIYSHGSGIDFYHNTVYLYGDVSESRVVSFDVDLDEPVNVHFMNNIFANLAEGYVMHGKFYEDTESVASSDYNVLYTNGDTFAIWDEQLITDFSQWQAVTGFDANSLSVDPELSAEELVPANRDLANAGVALAEVTQDIYGKERDSSPTIGAVELEEPEEQLPTANAGRDRTLVLPNNSITLSGRGTVENGRFVAYRWEKVNGPSVTITGQNTANVNLSDLEEGEYVFRFSATDNRGRTATDEMTLTVEAGEQVNQAPIITAGRDRTVQIPVERLILTGTGYDPDGRFTAFLWEKVSGPAVTMNQQRTANLILTDLSTGEYVFRFSATDNDGATSSDEVTITVLAPANQSPIVSAGRDRTITNLTTQYILSGTGYDPDGRFTAFLWEKVSGPSVNMMRQNTANVILTDLEAGEYVFRFSATDNRGATSSDEMRLTVVEGAEDVRLAGNTKIAAYPNTFQNYVNVEIEAEEQEEYQIMVYDMQGKTYYQSSFVPDAFNAVIHTIDFSGQELQAGAYLIRVQSRGGKFQKVLKIVKAY